MISVREELELILSMLNVDISYFENSQLLRSQLIKIYIVFHFTCKFTILYMIITGTLQINWIKIGEELTKISIDKGLKLKFKRNWFVNIINIA